MFWNLVLASVLVDGESIEAEPASSSGTCEVRTMLIVLPTRMFQSPKQVTCPDPKQKKKKNMPASMGSIVESLDYSDYVYRRD